MRISPEAAALLFINRFYPNCEAAFLAGSVVRNEATANSDLDIVVIDDMTEGVNRVSYTEFGWPIEVFIYTRANFFPLFESDCMIGIPYLPRMCAEGIILKDNKGFAKEIKKEAIDRIEEGPATWSDDLIEQTRYIITDLLDDLLGSNNGGEDLFIAGKLAETLHDFILRTNKQWCGYGKWVVRALKQYDEKLADQFVSVFSEFYRTGNKQGIEQFVDKILDPFGGRLFTGFKR